jgi:hypothetical protein
VRAVDHGVIGELLARREHGRERRQQRRQAGHPQRKAADPDEEPEQDDHAVERADGDLERQAQVQREDCRGQRDGDGEETSVNGRVWHRWVDW